MSALPLVLTLLCSTPATARHRDPPPAPVQPPVQIIYKYVDPPPEPPSPVVDYTPDLMELWKLVSGDGTLDALESEFRRGWLSIAMPFFKTIVPATAPKTVVYPFGGGDLVSALAVFPDATDITTISLEPAGEAAAMFRGGGAGRRMEQIRKDVGFLLHVAFSKTESMGSLADEDIPAQILFSLMAQAVHGFTPTGLKYFKLMPDGKVHYYTQKDLKDAATVKNTHVFDDCEITFKRGNEPERVHRHIYIDLSDARFLKDPVLAKFLDTKGRVSAMTKACSYLLWEDAFSKIREYLLTHADWMVSDATGIPPHVARAAGYEQETYGNFTAAILKVDHDVLDEFRELWKKQPRRKLAFRFGYPNHGSGEGHLMITRPKAH